MNYIQSQQVQLVGQGFNQFRLMLNVVDAINLKHEIFEIKEHLRHVFEATLNSGIHANMITVLNIQNDQQIPQIKLDILKCLGLITYGLKIFKDNEVIGGQNNQ